MRRAVFTLLMVVTPAVAGAAPAARAAAAAAADPLEAALAGGRYEDVDAQAPRAKSRADADAILGAALRLRGRYADARRVLEAVVAHDGRALRARVELGLVYRAIGDRATERAMWERFYDDFDAGKIDKKSARELYYMAEAARYYGGWQDSNDLFRDAVNADAKGPVGARANVEWAALFLEKYDAGHAEQCLNDALKVVPDDADAHALMARVKLEQSYDVPAAERELDAALRKNPRHAGALAIRAELFVDNEQYKEAIAACDKILAINPEDVRARELTAASKWLREDPRGYAAERDRVLQTNPSASTFFAGVADLLVKSHRYDDAATLYEEAIKRDPKDYVALAALGANWLRMGDEPRGLDALRRAWDGDPFNVRTFNLLNLFEKVIPADYTMIESKPFRFRVATRDRAIVERYVEKLVAREHAELVKRYGFTPTGPLTLELYTTPDHFAVRTIGLPGTDGMLGVTFGRVITSISPSLGKFNWGMTLWHEVGHVFSVQLSKYRVPRWFTEGLSEYETARARPDWTRHTHAELWHAVEEGRLLSVAELNGGFIRARDVSHMVVTYHQAAETVAFLIRRYGFDKAVAALKLFAAGKETRDVIPAVTGVDVKTFDAAFRDDLVARLAAYRGTFFVRASDYSDVDALRERIKQKPDDLRAQGLYALALVAARHGDEARAIVDKSLRFDSGKHLLTDPRGARELILAAAQLATQRKDAENARFFYDALVKNGGDGYDARYGLGVIAAAAGDVAEAEKQLALAKKMDPDRNEPHLELAKLYMKTREDDALRELEEAARLDCMDASIPKVLIEKHAARARWAKVVELAPLALYTDPFDVQLHIRLARAYVETSRSADARTELAAARECEPTDEQAREIDAVAKRLH
jgi:tetratricopeptide (TPR) repeat protein